MLFGQMWGFFNSKSTKRTNRATPTLKKLKRQFSTSLYTQNNSRSIRCSQRKQWTRPTSPPIHKLCISHFPWKPKFLYSSKLPKNRKPKLLPSVKWVRWHSVQTMMDTYQADKDTWCFTPSQPRRVISARNKMYSLTTSKTSDSLLNTHSCRWG